MAQKDWETNGLRHGAKVFCPVNCHSDDDCPYCDSCGLCHLKNPCEDCEDFAIFFSSWEDWDYADDVEPDAPEDFSEDEIEWARRHFGYRADYDEIEDYPDDEIGFNPYIGAYDYDC